MLNKINPMCLAVVAGYYSSVFYTVLNGFDVQA